MILILNPLKNEIWKGLNLFFPKDAHQKSEGVSEVRFKKLDSFTLETSKNHLIRNFRRNGRLKVKSVGSDKLIKLILSNTLEKRLPKLIHWLTVLINVLHIRCGRNVLL